MKLTFEWEEVDVDHSETEERYVNIGVSAKKTGFLY